MALDLAMNSKAQATKGKCDKLDFIKVIHSVSKDIIKKMKR